MDKVQIVVLAAGLGKRMNNQDLPKALIPLRGKPLASYVLEAIKKSGVRVRPVVVVGKMAGLVERELGPKYTYVFQAEQLGTGHALMVAKVELGNRADNILVLYGDQPLVAPRTIRKMVKTHLAEGSVLTMGIVRVTDFNFWRAGFYDFGRIVRDKDGKVIGIVEKKDATQDQLRIKEINPSYFCFQTQWLWQNLDRLKNNNAQKEYYLTDLIDIACKQGQKITTVSINPKEALGINTEEQLKLAEKLLA